MGLQVQLAQLAHNEGADRTYTITVTQEGSTDGSQKAIGDISSNVDGLLHLESL